MRNEYGFTSRLVKYWFMFFVIAISLLVGVCSLLRTFIEVNSRPMQASDANEDRVGTAAVDPDELGFDVAEGERRDEAATASSSLKLRLSLTRSDKLLTAKKREA